MNSVFFAVNRNQFKYFRFLAGHFQGPARVVYAKRAYLPSLAALRQLRRGALTPIVEGKIAELKARNPRLGSRGAWFFRGLFQLLAIVDFLRYWGPITQANAGVMGVWNGHFFRQSIARLIAGQHGIRCVFFENGLLPQTTTLDGAGVNYANSVPRLPAFFAARERVADLPTDLVPRAPKNSAKFAAKAADLPDRYLFIPFQIDHDTQIVLHSPWIGNMAQLFDVLEELSESGAEDFDLVFKEHPSSLKSYPALYEKIAAHPRMHLMNQVPTQTLIQQAEAVIVVNSTVGIEALLYGKKVIVLGQAFYAIDGIARKAENIGQLSAITQAIDGWEVDRPLLKRFLSYLYFDYSIPGGWKNPDVQHARAVEERFGAYHVQDLGNFHGFDPAASV